MTPSQLARVREADKKRKRFQRANRSEFQVERDRLQDRERARARRAVMHRGEVDSLREFKRVSHENQIHERSSELLEQRRHHDAEAYRERRDCMPDEAHQTIREQNTTARRAAREVMPEADRKYIEEQDTARESTNITRKSNGFRAGHVIIIKDYRITKTLTIPGGRHYFSQYTDNTQEHERVGSHYNAWKFPNETNGSRWRKGLVSVPAARFPAVELRRLYQNPGFMQLIRTYNNVSTFTSMRSSRLRSLNVGESITRSRIGVYNFRVQGYVCHRMGTLLTSPNRRSMYAHIYINDPDNI
ncbi:Helitron helicase [Phytophthora megakarya]|uniref:Helitron helicase n=1 Tax=Phytophthora megakarya TaxID=4795 RepID=A0A225WEY7_9STRA|nr:Helitron helicase [Phytophthora megakarya]